MKTSEAQQRFDAQYVSGLEIRKRLNVAGCTITLARQRGDLPEPIIVGGNVHVWERTIIEPYLAKWQKVLGVRRKHVIAGYQDSNGFNAAKLTVTIE